MTRDELKQIYEHIHFTPEEWAEQCCHLANVKMARRRHLIGHIAAAIRRALEQDRRERALEE